MSRKGSTPQRTVLPDPKHGSHTIARFINMVMYSGKKSVAGATTCTQARFVRSRGRKLSSGSALCDSLHRRRASRGGSRLA